MLRRQNSINQLVKLWKQRLLTLLEVPKQFENRYGIYLKDTHIYVRNCYVEQYAKMADVMLSEEGSTVLFLGVSGIGKPMFLIYFNDKRNAFESGHYDYYNHGT
mmetsp:Transcript_19656/g.26984  ORF Transcript_19656/g.26984 Transcript_19656/m.26984 type:complete len:104 (-) Transcript_19656:737-1048(-)